MTYSLRGLYVVYSNTTFCHLLKFPLDAPSGPEKTSTMLLSGAKSGKGYKNKLVILSNHEDKSSLQVHNVVMNSWSFLRKVIQRRIIVLAH